MKERWALHSHHNHLQYIQIQTANEKENTEGTNGQQLF
jgi:hypothetical protein